jgi:hypothetical protein
MTTPSDMAPAPESVTFGRGLTAPSRAEDVEAMSLAQEINERRARVENAELLQNLRSL